MRYILALLTLEDDGDIIDQTDLCEIPRFKVDRMVKTITDSPLTTAITYKKGR